MTDLVHVPSSPRLWPDPLKMRVLSRILHARLLLQTPFPATSLPLLIPRQSSL